MGCISSKLLATADDLDRRISTHHVVSLTSSTYGVLSLDRRRVGEEGEGEEQEKEVEESSVVVVVAGSKVATNRAPIPIPFTPQKKKPSREALPTEVINTWELMKDLTGNQTAIWSPAMKPAIKPAVPAPAATPTPGKRKVVLQGKENNNNNSSSVSRPLSSSANSTPKEVVPSRVLRPFSSAANKKPSPLAVDVKIKPSRTDREWGGGAVGSKRSLSPLFDPELVASFERELRREGREQIKKMVSPKPELLESFELRCPPGGGNAVVLYTTTLRGIRKTFEDCNAARGAVESHGVRVVEKDISMDSGFREELRAVMGRKEVRPPVVFVKGRLIGGAEEVLKLEEEGKLGLLFEGMPKNDEKGCGVCGGMRFVMCRECNGSCKVLLLHDEEGRSTVKCEHCNENGLIHCPNCTC